MNGIDTVTTANARKETIAAYERGAKGYTQKYEGRAVRKSDVDLAFSCVTVKDPKVVEIGSGSGREAAYILEKIATENYLGFDISKEILKIARARVSNARFVEADLVSFKFPQNTDIVFSFASLLHSNKEELAAVFVRIHASLNEKGIVLLSLKRRSTYQDEIKKDEFGSRHFFYYTREAVLEAARDLFEEVYYDERQLEEDWLSIVLRKK